MTEADPAQPLDRQDPRDRRGYRIEHGPGAAVEQQRLLRIHQELVEGESRRRRDVRHEGREPVNAFRDLRNVGAHVRDSSSAAVWLPAYAALRPAMKSPAPRQDRKSTRLNSSH